MNWAVVAPTGTVTDAGTVNPLVFVADSAITAPPAGAGGSQRHRARSSYAAVDHGGRVHGHAGQRCRARGIHRQRRGLGHAAVGGRDGHGRRDRHRLLVVTTNVFVVAPAGHRHRDRHRRRIDVVARQRHHRTARRRRAGECHRAGAPARARHCRWIDAYAEQSCRRRIHRQRRGLDHAAVCGRDGHGRRDRHRHWW